MIIIMDKGKLSKSNLCGGISLCKSFMPLQKITIDNFLKVNRVMMFLKLNYPDR